MIFTVDKTSDGINPEPKLKEFNTLDELINFIDSQEDKKVIIFTNMQRPHIEIYDDFCE
jgi:ERCC4-related helicase